MFHAVFRRILLLVVSYSYVSFNGFIISVGEERIKVLLSFTCNYVFLLGGVFPSS